ncbi:MAG: DUF362 domain-containing protein, partial [Candidatus Methanomethylophilaceae archaeon]|nr:DUF362 domain-containing protein [Candidatus Methanomethylophilaceae archaeon]
PKVFFTDMRCGIDESLLDKTRRLVKAAGIDGIGMDKKFVAIKMHFGELGNLSFLRPNFPRTIAGIVRENGGIPYLTDCNTLYPGSRKNAVEHLECAEINGFNSVSAGCRIIIGDGLRGTDDAEIPVDGEYVKSAKIGRAIADCDVLITLTHFKCHEITGFGGAIKNLAMGCASRRGKMEMHSAGKPSLNPDKCVGCGRCVKSCGQNAIRIANKKAEINGELCAGCGRCIGMCNTDAIYAEYDQDGSVVNKKMVEYAAAVIKDRPNFHVSFVMDVSPFCDCHSGNDVPIVPDVGILASFDPIALDRACADLVMRQPVNPGGCLAGKDASSADIFTLNQPGTNWRSHFEHAEKMGLGNGDYELVEVR